MTEAEFNGIVHQAAIEAAKLMELGKANGSSWMRPVKPTWAYSIIQLSAEPKIQDLNEIASYDWEIFQVTQEADHWKVYCKKKVEE